MTRGADDNGVVRRIRITLVRIARTFLSLMGLLWTPIVIWVFLMAGGLSLLHFAYLGKAILWCGWWFVGPLFLIAGPLLYSKRKYRMFAAILLGVGCTILSAEVGWILQSVIQDLADPLIARPPYGLYASGLVLTVLTDICAVQLIRKRRVS